MGMIMPDLGIIVNAMQRNPQGHLKVPNLPASSSGVCYHGGAVRVRTRTVASCRSATAMNGGSTSTVDVRNASITPRTNAAEMCPGRR